MALDFRRPAGVLKSGEAGGVELVKEELIKAGGLEHGVTGTGRVTADGTKKRSRNFSFEMGKRQNATNCALERQSAAWRPRSTQTCQIPNLSAT